jgi:murein DD-endopeptidase MepM/ murein hydrolase activator NlpD
MTRGRISIQISPLKGGRSVEIGITTRAIKLLVLGIALAILLGLFGMGRLGALYRRMLLQGASPVTPSEPRRVHADELSRLEGEVAALKDAEREIRTLTTSNLPGGLDEAIVAIGGDSALARLFAEETSVLPEAGLLWPWEGPISRRFESGVHTGLDIAGPAGAAVVAAGAGRVDFAGWDEVFGHMIVLDHGGGVRTVYGHNQRLAVASGQLVQAGQTIAYLGSSGRSSGPHLHFELRWREIPLPPEAYMRKRGGATAPGLSGKSALPKARSSRGGGTN